MPCHGKVPGSIPGGTAKIKGPDVNGRQFDLQSKRMGSIPTVSTKKHLGMLGSLVTPPALGAGELAGSNPAIPTTMKTLLKDPRFYFFLWIVLSIILAITLGACKQKPLIEKGDVVEKFVIDSMVQLPPHSTIELDRKYKYFMSDSSEFTSLKKYNIGDTITYVYKKQGK